MVEASQTDLARFTPVLEQHLAGRDYLVGDSATIADYSVITLEKFIGAVPFDWAPYPNVLAYFDRIRKVDYWASTAPASPADTAGGVTAEHRSTWIALAESYIATLPAKPVRKRSARAKRP